MENRSPQSHHEAAEARETERSASEPRREGYPPYGPGPGEWARAVGTFDPRAKSPVLACVLSLVPGLGQIYVGDYTRGFLHAGSFAGLIALLAAMSDREFTPLAPMTAIFMGFFFLYNIIDAGRRAALYNQALQGGAVTRIPDLEATGQGGSLLGGGILITGGFILLMHTRFGMSMDWVETWWPIFPMMMGAYLVYKHLASRAVDEER